MFWGQDQMVGVAAAHGLEGEKEDEYSNIWLRAPEADGLSVLPAVGQAALSFPG